MLFDNVYFDAWQFLRYGPRNNNNNLTMFFTSLHLSLYYGSDYWIFPLKIKFKFWSKLDFLEA